MVSRVRRVTVLLRTGERLTSLPTAGMEYPSRREPATVSSSAGRPRGRCETRSDGPEITRA